VLAVVQYVDDGNFYSSATDGFYLQANTLADLVATTCRSWSRGRGVQQ